MDRTDYAKIDQELGFSFGCYIVNLPDDSPLTEPITDKGEAALLVFLTEDPDFNAWSLRRAAENPKTDDVPDRPVALYYVPVGDPPSVSNVDWSKAKALGRFVLKSADEATPRVAI